MHENLEQDIFNPKIFESSYLNLVTLFIFEMISLCRSYSRHLFETTPTFITVKGRTGLLT